MVNHKRPTLAKIKAHDGNCDHNCAKGFRTDFTFFDHSAYSDEVSGAHADDCEELRRPCAVHQCYALMYDKG